MTEKVRTPYPKAITEAELEAIFYTNYREWEEKFKRWVSKKTDRKMTIMEPVFFSFDKDIDEEDIGEADLGNYGAVRTSPTSTKGQKT